MDILKEDRIMESVRREHRELKKVSGLLEDTVWYLEMGWLPDACSIKVKEYVEDKFAVCGDVLGDIKFVMYKTINDRVDTND